MTAERWNQIRTVFDAAIERSPGERTSFVREACAGDLELHSEVVALLSSFDETTDFLEEPVAPLLSFNEQLVDAMEGRHVGPYQLVRRIGKGGMGTVYAAQRADHHFTKLVAVKLVKPGMDSEEILRRFRNERQMLAGLDHPNIARLLDGGTTPEGLPFIVMEYVDGVTIDRYCEANKPSVRDILKLFCQVCSAVQYAHQNLVVHRDIKPGNILVTADACVKLLDFGIAKVLRDEYSGGMDLTRTQMRAMTPEYASPEQVRGEPITTASDVYSLGVLLYRLLTSHPPYQWNTRAAVEIERVILDEEPERPSLAALRTPNSEKLSKSLRGDLDMILLMALRKEPQRRYASVERFAEDIGRFQDGLPVRACKDTLRYRVSKFVTRHTAAVVAGACVTIALSLSTVVSLKSANRAEVERQRAERRFNDVRQLANFVLFDLDRAITAGTTAARKTVIEQALIYLNRLVADSGGNPELQRELIEGYWKVGNLQGNQMGPNLGDDEGAKQSYRKALELAEALHTAHPEDSKILGYVAISKMKLGDLLSVGGSRREALELYKAAQDVFTPLASHDVQAAEQLLEVSRKVGWTHSALGNMGEAQRSFEKHLEIAASFAAKKNSPAARTEVAYGYLHVGEIVAKTGNINQGLEKMRRALQLYEELRKEAPANAQAQRDVVTTNSLIGDVLAGQKKYAEAAEHFRRALLVTKTLAAGDPRNMQFQRDLHVTLGRLADAAMQSGALAEARSSTIEALQALRPLVEGPQPLAYDVHSYCWLLLTTEFEDLRNPAAARVYAEKLVAMTAEKDPAMLDLLARAHYAAGDATKAVGMETRAIALLPRDSASDLRKELETNLAKFQARASR